MSVTHTTDQTKRIVDTRSPEAIKVEVEGLIAQLKAATHIKDKKRIRRMLRTRDYYLSRQGTSNTVATMQAANNPLPAPEVNVAPNNDAEEEAPLPTTNEEFLEAVATIVKAKPTKKAKGKKKAK